VRILLTRQTATPVGCGFAVLVAAVVRVGRARGEGSASWFGFAIWAVAGAVFTFSLLTGLSIGLFLLPLVVLAIGLAVRVASEVRSMLGFAAGIALILLVVAAIHDAATGWLVPGIALAGIAVASFAGGCRIDRHRTR
jgi:hypothetical protein